MIFKKRTSKRNQRHCFYYNKVFFCPKLQCSADNTQPTTVNTTRTTIVHDAGKNVGVIISNKIAIITDWVQNKRWAPNSGNIDCIREVLHVTPTEIDEHNSHLQVNMELNTHMRAPI